MGVLLYFSTSIAKLASVAGVLVLQVFVARLLGVEEFGRFTAYFVVLNFVGICSRFGNDNYIMKYGAVLKSMNNFSELRSFYLKSLCLVAVLVLIWSLIANIGFGYFGYEAGLTFLLFPCLLAVMNLSFINSYLVRSQGQPIKSCLLEFGISAGAAAGVLLILSLAQVSLVLKDVFIVLLSTTLILSCLGVYVSFRLFVTTMKLHKQERLADIRSRYQNTSRSNYVFSAIALFATQWIAPMLLLNFHTAQDLGLYNAAYTITMSIGFVMLVMSSIISPRISSYYDSDDIIGLRKLYQKTTVFMVVIALPVTVVFVWFPETLLSIYGDSFSPASTVVKILAISQMVNICFGATNPMLNMTNYSNLLRSILIVSSLSGLLIGYILIPKYGIEGAAYTVLITNLSMNVLAVYFIHRRLNITLVG